MRHRPSPAFLVFIAVIAAGILFLYSAPTCTPPPISAKEAVLREDLFTLRECINQYHADKGRYPPALETLIQERYIRKIPRNPFTHQESWRLVRSKHGTGIIDVRSEHSGRARDGSQYESW